MLRTSSGSECGCQPKEASEAHHGIPPGPVYAPPGMPPGTGARCRRRGPVHRIKAPGFRCAPTSYWASPLARPAVGSSASVAGLRMPWLLSTSATFFGCCPADSRRPLQPVQPLLRRGLRRGEFPSGAPSSLISLREFPPPCPAGGQASVGRRASELASNKKTTGEQGTLAGHLSRPTHLRLLGQEGATP